MQLSGFQCPMYHNSANQPKRNSSRRNKPVCGLLLALVFTLTNQIAPTHAEFEQCFPDDEEIIFEDELYATSTSTAWWPIPGVAIFIFMVAGIVIFSFAFSWFVREYLDAYCEFCWSCGKGEKYDDDEEEEEEKDVVRDTEEDKRPVETLRLKSARKGRRKKDPDIERQESNLSEEPDELTWQIKVDEFLRDMPDGASVNHLYNDSFPRKSSLASSRFVNEKDRHTDTDTEATPRTHITVTSSKDGNKSGNETDRSGVVTTQPVASTSGVKESPTTPVPSTSKTQQQTGSRPRTAAKAPASKSTTAHTQQSERSPTRPLTAGRSVAVRSTIAQTQHQPVGAENRSRPQTAGRTSAARPTTGAAAHRTSKVSPERPKTRQGGRPATRHGNSESPAAAPVTPTSARKREQQKKFDDAWDQQQDVKALALDDDEYLQDDSNKPGSLQTQLQTPSKPTPQEQTREPARPLIGIRRPSQTAQQFKTTGRMTKSYNRKDSGISVSQKTESPVSTTVPEEGDKSSMPSQTSATVHR